MLGSADGINVSSAKSYHRFQNSMFGVARDWAGNSDSRRWECRHETGLLTYARLRQQTIARTEAFWAKLIRMPCPPFQRRAVAILAAYALALQALLSAFAVPVQAAPVAAASICSGGGRTDSGQPARHAGHKPGCAVCSVSGCAGPILAPVEAGPAFVVERGPRANTGLPARHTEIELTRSRPQLPRAPPVAL